MNWRSSRRSSPIKYFGEYSKRCWLLQSCGDKCRSKKTGDDQCVVLKSVRLCRHTYFPILHCLYVSLYTVVVVFDGDILSTYRVKKVEQWFILRTTRKQIPFTQRRVKLTRHAPLGAPEIFSSDYRRGKISLGILCTFMVSLLSDPIVGRCRR